MVFLSSVLPSTPGAEVVVSSHDPAILKSLNWNWYDIVSGDHSSYRLRRSGPPGPRLDVSTLAPIPEPPCPDNALQFIKVVS